MHGVENLGPYNFRMQSSFRSVPAPGVAALTSQPQNLVRFRQAFVLHQAGQLVHAQALYLDILKQDPCHAESLHYLGVIAAQNKDLQKALALIQKALEIKPDYVEAYYNCGNVLKDLRQYEAAVASYKKAVALRSNYAEAYANCGVALKAIHRFEDALACYEKAISINPNYLEAHYNRGNVLKDLHRFEAAIASYDKVIALRPDFASAYVNRGNALKELAHFDAALLCYDKALAIHPGHVDACWNKSLTLLLGGNFEEGWPLYEWRWKSANFTSLVRTFMQPLWRGKESVEGKTVLVHSEQGLGDTLQFCRYVKLLSDLGARVILEVYQPLATLLQNIEGLSDLIVKGSDLPPFDYHCPLLGLPLAFKTDLNSIPCSPKYIPSDLDKMEKWRKSVVPKKTLIGLVWSGNQVHKNDRNRSIPLANFLQMLPGGFQYVSLQKDVRDCDKRVLESNPQIIHFGNQLRDFSDTAALCELMDVVISVDTSVAHISGAVGTRTWILLPFVPDWRWLLDRSDSPWYPSVKLYRQSAIGDWGGVFSRITSDLNALPPYNCPGS